FVFFFQAEDGIRDRNVTGVQTCALPILRDRIVQGALRRVLEPIFERDFCQHSYGFRPGRGAKDALRRVEGLLREGQVWVVDANQIGRASCRERGEVWVGGVLCERSWYRV